jgi:LPXTG-motif cell wall-anchored protein
MRRGIKDFSQFGISLIILALLLLPGLVMAQEAVTVQLDPMDGSGVSGTATLTAAGEGTQVELDIQGLAPGTSARATMQANTCATPSASFAALPDLQADATGRATAIGSVLFRGTENVALATMADGEHIITIQTGQVVACGVIPRLTSASTSSTLPATGGAAPWLMAAVAGILGLCALTAGLFLRRRSRPLRRFYNENSGD